MLRSSMLILLLFTARAGGAEGAAVFRVDAGCSREHPTGGSWADAFSNLQEGIDAAFQAGGGEVWVKAGVYRPEGDQRNSGFVLRPGIRLYGGFRGTETACDARNPKANRTVLNGGGGMTGRESDNCIHLVTGANESLLDGFIITRGNAGGLKDQGSGGGVFIPAGTRAMRISDCTFEKNLASWRGGAIYGERIELVVSNCSFFANASTGGGALAVRGASSIDIRNCVFSANTAGTAGGAVSLENDSTAVIRASRFLLNTSEENGGAVAIDLDEGGGLEITDCTFSDNTAKRSGGGVFLTGTCTPHIKACGFTRNTGMAGTGGIAIEGNIQASVEVCSFENNRGIKKTDLSHAASSAVFATREALLHALGPEEEQPEIEPPRILDESFVHDPRGKKKALRKLIADKPFTVIACGDLTDTAFIKSYRIIEALAVDFKKLKVQFFYLYSALAHPENNGYIQPFFLEERIRQAQLAESLLNTKTPWLCDGMDHQTLKALQDGDESNVFIYSAEGAERYRGALRNHAALQSALQNLAGDPSTTSRPDAFNPPAIPATDPGTPVLTDRVHFKPYSEAFAALHIIPTDSKHPFYVKLRAEADADLLDSGNGRLYLGFHLDPLYRMQWDNEAAPLEYVIRSPAGMAAPSTDRAPEIRGVRHDSEPREFVLTTRQLDASKPLALRVEYSVYSPLRKKSITVSQTYTIELKRDPFGGKAYRRQIAYRDASRRKTVSMPIQLRHLDSNQDGKLSRAELSGSWWSRFPEMDTDKDGYLSADEYSAYLRSR